MPFNWFHPKPGAFGSVPEFSVLDPVGRSGRTLTTSGSTTYVLPTPYRKFYVRGASAQCSSLAAGGTTVAKIQKVVAGTGTPVVLTSGLTLEGMTAKVTSKIAMASTATDANRMVGEGDVLEVQFINTGGITTQPLELYVHVELQQLE